MSGAGRWFSGVGINVMPPRLWNERPYRVMIVRLSTMRDTADSFTHRLLYQIAAGCEGVFVDCAWLPPPEDGLLFDRYGIPWMTGVVTKRPAVDFDCIAISNSIVQELINIPVMMRKSGIPLEKKERMMYPEIPLVILGGANALFTSSLISDDPPVDIIFTGEDAGLIARIFGIGADAKSKEEPKEVLIRRLLGIEGIIEPDSPEPTRKSRLYIDISQQLCKGPVFAGENNTSKGWLRISEGCPYLCSFCAEAWSRRPYTEATVAECINAALAMKISTGIDRIELYSFNFNMYRHLRTLLWELSGMFTTIGLKSQRLDCIADDPELIRLLHAFGKSSITVGIEGISDRLRRWLHKGLDDCKLYRGLSFILGAPVREMKLFFLATGMETTDDIDEFRRLISFIDETAKKVSRFPRIIVSFTPMVRFPFTPLENEPAPDLKTVSETMLQCERIVCSRRFEFRRAASLNEYIFSQAFVRANGAQVWKALCDTVAMTDFVYYKDIPDYFINALKERLDTEGIDIWQLLYDKDKFTKLPVIMPFSNTRLKTVTDADEENAETENRLFYMSDSSTDDKNCRPVSSDDNKDLNCRRGIAYGNKISVERFRARIKENSRYIKVYLFCNISEEMRGIKCALTASIQAKIFMGSDPLLAYLYRGFGGSLIENRFGTEWIHGDDVITLMFQEAAKTKLIETIENKNFYSINRMPEKVVQIKKISLSPINIRSMVLKIVSPWNTDPAGYLTARSLKHTAIRAGKEKMVYKLTKDAVKKKIIESVEMSLQGNEYCIRVTPGDKFRYDEFLQSAISLPSEKHRVRVKTEAQIEIEE